MRKHSSGRSRVHEQCRLMILPGKVLCSNLRDESPFATAAATTLAISAAANAASIDGQIKLKGKIPLLRQLANVLMPSHVVAKHCQGCAATGFAVEPSRLQLRLIKTLRNMSGHVFFP